MRRSDDQSTQLRPPAAAAASGSAPEPQQRRPPRLRQHVSRRGADNGGSGDSLSASEQVLVVPAAGGSGEGALRPQSTSPVTPVGERVSSAGHQRRQPTSALAPAPLLAQPLTPVTTQSLPSSPGSGGGRRRALSSLVQGAAGAAVLSPTSAARRSHAAEMRKSMLETQVRALLSFPVMYALWLFACHRRCHSVTCHIWPPLCERPA